MCYENRWKPASMLAGLSLLISLGGLTLLIQSFFFRYRRSSLLKVDFGPELSQTIE